VSHWSYCYHKRTGLLSTFLLSPTLVLASELVKYDIDHNGSYEFTRTLDRSRDPLLRDTGFQLKEGATLENQADYTYSATDGRLATVGSPAAVTVPENTLPPFFTYSYLSNSNLPAQVTGPVHTVTNT
jgi:hypothetical protein